MHPKSYKEPTPRRLHINSVHAFTHCCVCKKSFTTERGYNKHNNLTHTWLDLPRVVPPPESDPFHSPWYSSLSMCMVGIWLCHIPTLHHHDRFPPGGNVTGGNLLGNHDDDGNDDWWCMISMGYPANYHRSHSHQVGICHDDEGWEYDTVKIPPYT